MIWGGRLTALHLQVKDAYTKTEFRTPGSDTMILFQRLKKSFRFNQLPENYDHSDKGLVPGTRSRFIYLNLKDQSGGIGNIRWVNSDPSSNRWGFVLWAGRWSLVFNYLEAK